MDPGLSSNASGGEEEEDWKVARRGVCLVLNNQYDEALALFKNKGDSIQLAVGHAYIGFMNATMTIEKGTVQEALVILKELESRCAGNLGWLRAMKNKVLGRNPELSTYGSLEQQIALADCQVCIAILTLMTGDWRVSWMKAGWALRKAWSLYHSSYTYLAGEYQRVFGLSAELPGCESVPWRVLKGSKTEEEGQASPVLPDDETAGTSSGNSGGGSWWSGMWSYPTTPETPITPNGIKRSWSRMFSSYQSPQLHGEEIRRLMGGACFGYGLFHLCVSLLPNTLLKLMQLLGFYGDRVIGLEALAFARKGPDMRAPLATLALLWYETIMRPISAADPEAIAASVVAASEPLLQESKAEFGESALFLFFQGKVHRLNNRMEEAVEYFAIAKEKSGHRELSLLCLHEAAWCHLIKLDFQEAFHTFSELKNELYWSKSFYPYVAAVCGGILGDFDAMETLVAPVLRLSGTVPHVDIVICRRARMLLPKKSIAFYKIMAYEMIYLWNNLPPREGVLAIITDLESREETEEEPMLGLKDLLLGACFARVGEIEKAVKHLCACINTRIEQEVRGGDSHIGCSAYYELGHIHLVHYGDTKEGLRLMRIAASYFSDYDFESRHSLRIQSVLNEYKI